VRERERDLEGDGDLDGINGLCLTGDVRTGLGGKGWNSRRCQL
jgi:hypothetical protein